LHELKQSSLNDSIYFLKLIFHFLSNGGLEVILACYAALRNRRIIIINGIMTSAVVAVEIVISVDPPILSHVARE